MESPKRPKLKKQIGLSSRLGCFVGYSALLMAQRLRSPLFPYKRDESYSNLTKKFVQMASKHPTL